MQVAGQAFRSVWLDGSVVKAIDQRRLPHEFVIVDLPNYRATAEAIRDMTIRGAGAIGAAAGFAMAQAALEATSAAVVQALEEAASVVRATRPTARDLFYAVERVLGAAERAGDAAAGKRAAVETAQALADANAAAAEAIGRHGAALLQDGARVLTHCNAGWLAMVDWGSALSPIYLAHRRGRRVSVWVTETRPRSQGAKLTAWELAQEGVAHTVVADTAVGSLFQRRQVDLVLVGADRIAANGDVANKIGTYTIATLAHLHRVPMYVAAPLSTIDAGCPSGQAIPIEERDAEEVVSVAGAAPDGRPSTVRIAPEGSPALNPAFDVTPASLLTGLITEEGVIPADASAISRVLERHAVAAHE